MKASMIFFIGVHPCPSVVPIEFGFLAVWLAVVADIQSSPASSVGQS